MITKFLSYFFPITVKKYSSSISNQLDITWQKGELNLNSKNTNYSYGNLERVLRDGLKYIGERKIKNMDSILILGLGAGSVVDTLRNHIQYENKITSIELDPIVIDLGKKYFKLNELQHKHTIIQIDAFEYALRSKETFNLIIIDIFQDHIMPSFLFEDYFIRHIKKMLRKDGFILFNTITLNQEHKLRNEKFISLFDNTNYSTRIYPKSLKYNELLTIKKLS
ncbi:spermidine synthase [Myroides pelagicus]|uniref:Spermidine synthase n=1 Tax=Myroides pelagicus TaxID=270914 RepID=A0A7K1GJM7_9FLAO|nr:fused MFS/spermidine synthase [Myroides pelagicus]MEC4113810.1 fused MFS/spermidine synthase [Myroides pelagicus]MTH29082.1 spermidine synthase [Myroides pelagicus]